MNTNMGNYNKVLAIIFTIIFLPIHLEKNIYFCIFQAHNCLRTSLKGFPRAFKNVTC